VKTVIGAGGPVVYSANPRYVLEGALFDKREPDVLKPVSPLFYLDQEYILFAIGLLALENPLKALRIAKNIYKKNITLILQYRNILDFLFWLC
jgi:hypothetical protein